MKTRDRVIFFLLFFVVGIGLVFLLQTQLFFSASPSAATLMFSSVEGAWVIDNIWVGGHRGGDGVVRWWWGETAASSCRKRGGGVSCLPLPLFFLFRQRVTISRLPCRGSGVEHQKKKGGHRPRGEGVLCVGERRRDFTRFYTGGIFFHRSTTAATANGSPFAVAAVVCLYSRHACRDYLAKRAALCFVFCVIAV